MPKNVFSLCSMSQCTSGATGSQTCNPQTSVNGFSAPMRRVSEERRVDRTSLLAQTTSSRFPRRAACSTKCMQDDNYSQTTRFWLRRGKRSPASHLHVFSEVNALIVVPKGKKKLMYYSSNLKNALLPLRIKCPSSSNEFPKSFGRERDAGSNEYSEVDYKNLSIRISKYQQRASCELTPFKPFPVGNFHEK